MKVVKKSDGFIQMDFPNRMPSPVSEVPEALLKGLSIASPKSILKNNQAYFAIYSNEDDVLSVIQDSEQLKSLAPYDVVEQRQVRNLTSYPVILACERRS